jgi:hypothetical protein
MTDTAAATIAPSPAEAAATLDARMQDEVWRSAMLKGSGPEVAEMKALVAAKITNNPDAESQRLDAIIDGSADSTQLETVYDGALSSGKMKIVASDLKNIGVSEASIKEFFSGHKYSKEIVAAAAEYARRSLADPAWRVRYAAGGDTERREVAL